MLVKFFFCKFMDHAIGKVLKLAKEEIDQYSPNIQAEQASPMIKYLLSFELLLASCYVLVIFFVLSHCPQESSNCQPNTLVNNNKPLSLFCTVF